MVKNDFDLVSKEHIRFVLNRFLQGDYGLISPTQSLALLEFAHMINAIPKSEYDRLYVLYCCL